MVTHNGATIGGTGVIRSTFTYRAGQVLTHDQMNGHISGPIDDLSGDNGVIYLRNGYQLPEGGFYFGMPRGTTAQRPTSPPVGAERWNVTTNMDEWWNGTEWIDSEDPSFTSFANLQYNGGVGVGGMQIARGNHSHAP